ncbi:hypothetical protein J3458_003557 [Metarhizium acridum]|uniref:uncharacterized protein n=1 Tax=Metarhizium acridum TaxID=92637 RepID=UPI001C6C143E|nr:hypothetical protein J3458_003557 [Metarhizium acridum]
MARARARERERERAGSRGKRPRRGKFLHFLTELDPGFIRPLVEAIQSGEITVSDIQLAFKRALSETMEKRWTDFESGEKAAEILKNIVVDIFATVRYATPPGFWQDVARNLPDIAREVSKAQTPRKSWQLPIRMLMRLLMCGRTRQLARSTRIL